MQETADLSAGWPELSLRYGILSDTRIAANILVRSAVFSTLDYAGGAVRPVVTEAIPLATIAPYMIGQVAGVRLSQSDADLFYWLLSRVYRDGVPKNGHAYVFFKRGEALSALGRARGGKTDVLLDESLMRLCEAKFVYEMPGRVDKFRLLSSVERFEDGDKPYDYRVTVSDSVAALLDDGEWLLLGKDRQRLASDSLAKGLHAFYASHQTIFPMLPATLKRLMGRNSMQDSKWRHALEKALARVQEVTGWFRCELVKAGDNQGKVVVIKGARAGYPRRTKKVLDAPEIDTQ